VSKFKKPCLKCGRLTLGESLCETHLAEKKFGENALKSERKKQSGQYSGSYKRRAAEVRRNAVVCHLCGGGFKANDPWVADHVIAGSHGDSAILAAAHKSCNESRGNKPIEPFAG
jgi:hypothetical protein